MEKRDEVSVFLRPRRFGKSTNLSMLRSFFSFGAESQDFSEFLIGQETEVMEEHCGKYPVVMMNMKDICGDTWKEILDALWAMLKDVMICQASYLDKEDIQYNGIKYFDAESNPNESNAKHFLLQLPSCLQQKYQKRVIGLIDGCDAPLNHAFRMGFYDSASEFFGSFYSNGLKSNDALKRACLMGIAEWEELH
jgi:Predicted AAA-ATPase